MEQYKNSVELIGHYGSDETIALSAWCSTKRELTEERKLRIPEFLADLAKNSHGTPFEKSTLHFLVTCDIASHIHILKHRIAVSVNSESARYKELKEDKLYVPIDWDDEERMAYLEHCLTAQQRYHQAIKRLAPKLGRKRAKESARFYLPYGSQLTMDVSFNLRSFLHFQGLRNSEHAQLEICDISQRMLEQVRATGDFTHSLAGFGY